ncbi:50S ribosomal protein L10 [candidate division KSB3 bacterium]|uniref:Large ribosomal subunit protein uL10 n=1 Tax=candidate division KSB3 bacterium TaxID=2044937 RepID=A0A2G6K7P3_9BACT|nr:MAG: 50S ribosomal protein L10 [candidate division KSB3 bacterium]
MIMTSIFVVNKTQKQDSVQQIKERFQESSSAICVDFLGVNVEKITQFRRELQEVSSDYQVVKNTLARRAVKETGFEDLRQFFVGPTGVIFCPGEVAESAKVVSKFADGDGAAITIKGGMVEGSVFDAAEIQKVATLPPRQELLSQLVAGLQAPISGLVGTLQGVVNEFVYTLQAVADKKSEDV